MCIYIGVKSMIMWKSFRPLRLHRAKFMLTLIRVQKRDILQNKTLNALVACRNETDQHFDFKKLIVILIKRENHSLGRKCLVCTRSFAVNLRPGSYNALIILPELLLSHCGIFNSKNNGSINKKANVCK